MIGATNQADSLDIGLRRAGRFDQEIAIGIPDDKQRKKFVFLYSLILTTTATHIFIKKRF